MTEVRLTIPHPDFQPRPSGTFTGPAAQSHVCRQSPDLAYFSAADRASTRFLLRSEQGFGPLRLRPT
jgi:hypothetical protein